jgi:hypothetical protein
MIFKSDRPIPEIKFIALHHTASYNNDKNQIHAVDVYHRDKDWGGGWTQPAPSELNWYVAYNFFCDVWGQRTQTRKIGEETLAQKGHNCDVMATCDTISYCMAGDFRVQEPNVHQEEDFIAFIEEVKKTYPNVRVVGHRDLHPGRTCPELPQAYIDKFNRQLDAPDQEKAEAIKKLQRELFSAEALLRFLKRILKKQR